MCADVCGRIVIGAGPPAGGTNNGICSHESVVTSDISASDEKGSDERLVLIRYLRLEGDRWLDRHVASRLHARLRQNLDRLLTTHSHLQPIERLRVSTRTLVCVGVQLLT
jgi:hypothetical protein